MTTLESDTILQPQAPALAKHRLVWDWPVRVFHWSLAASIVGAFVTNRLGVKYFAWHVAFGYVVIALIAFRLIWGLIGPRHARFVNFVRGPKAVLGYVAALGRGRRTRYAGHNPLGALMVIALLALVATQASFGLFANDEIFDAGPLAGLVSKSMSLGLTSLHRKIFYVIAAAVALHVVAVFAHVRLKRENLVLAMITGKKPAHLVRPQEAIASSRSLHAIALFVVIVVAIVVLAQFTAPADAGIGDF